MNVIPDASVSKIKGYIWYYIAGAVNPPILIEIWMGIQSFPPSELAPTPPFGVMRELFSSFLDICCLLIGLFSDALLHGKHSPPTQTSPHAERSDRQTDNGRRICQSCCLQSGNKPTHKDIYAPKLNSKRTVVVR